MITVLLFGKRIMVCILEVILCVATQILSVVLRFILLPVSLYFSMVYGNPSNSESCWDSAYERIIKRIKSEWHCAKKDSEKFFKAKSSAKDSLLRASISEEEGVRD